jgi:hypothetical protein
MRQEKKDAQARQSRPIFNSWDQQGAQHEQIRGDDVASDGTSSLRSKQAPKKPSGMNSSTHAGFAAPVPRYQTSACKHNPQVRRTGAWAGKAVSPVLVLALGQSLEHANATV